MRTILILFLTLFALTSRSQVFSEDFGGALICSEIDEADNFTTVNGNTWRVAYGTNNSSDTTQRWFISAREAYTGLGNCGAGCLGTGGLNKTLHVSTITNPGAVYNNDSIAEIYVFTPNINALGTTGDLKVEFDYLLGGDSTLDNASLVISVGASLTPPSYVISLPKTDTGNCSVTGQWQHFEYYMPSAVNTQALLGVGFAWQNNGDGNGAAPSFAVDNIMITEAPPLPRIGASDTTICDGGTVVFSDSSLGNPDTWEWRFGPNASTSVSTAKDPGAITFTTPGTYTVTLTVTNNNGTDSVFQNIHVVTCVPPVPGFSVVDNTICQGQCIDFTNTSQNGTFGQGAWTWQFQGGTPNVSTAENPSNICYTVAGTYAVTLTVTDTASGEIATTVFPGAITVGSCSVPVALFIQDTTEICHNDQITFYNVSTGPADSLVWQFEGGNPPIWAGNTAAADTVVVTYTVPGVYDVTLTAYNSAGDSTLVMTNHITVRNCPNPQPRFTSSSRKICPGEVIVFEDLSSYATSWFWEFPGGIPATSTDQNPADILYETPGVYPVTLTVFNVNGDSTLVSEGYIVVDSCLAPDPRFEVESDSICRGSCVQFFNTSLRADEFYWVFWWHPYPDSTDTIWVTNGATPPDTIDTFYVATDYFPLMDTIFNVQDPILCFDDSGTIGVQLIAENEYDIAIENQQDVAVLNIGGAYPVASAGPDKTIRIDNIESRFYLEDTVSFDGKGTGQYFSWHPQEGLSCYDCPRPIIHPTETRKYYLTNYDAYGCQVYDSVIVYVNDSAYAGIPNIFSPNGDNNNDVLWVRGNAIASDGFVLRIWDRYGEVIFESYSQNNGWDGTFKGNPAPVGTYTYYAKITFMDGIVEELSGSVTLVRY